MNTTTTIGKATILIVDDVEINRLILQEILGDLYQIEQAADGIEALSLLFSGINKPQLILLDIMMPGMDGFEVLSLLKANTLTNKIPVIFITAVNGESTELKGLHAGAVDYIGKPFNPEIVKLRVATHIELNLYRERLEHLVDNKVNELIAVKENFLETMANLIEYRSLESGQHVKRTRELTNILILQLLHTPEYCHPLVQMQYNNIIKAVPLHDIGKIAIPDQILLKPGKLTTAEFDIIKTHPVVGGKIIRSLMLTQDDLYLKHCYDICRYHHERWDGTGYPDGLSGSSIPLSARIVTVVDVYDALTSKRCYKQALTHHKAIQIIQQSSNSHFDPVIVKALLAVEKKFQEYTV